MSNDNVELKIEWIGKQTAWIDIQSTPVYDTVELTKGQKLEKVPFFSQGIFGRGLDKTNLYLEHGLPVPTSFQLYRIAFNFGVDTHSKVKRLVMERTWTLWIGDKMYHRDSMLAMRKQAEVICPSCKSEGRTCDEPTLQVLGLENVGHYVNLDIPVWIQSLQPFNIRFEHGLPLPGNLKLRCNLIGAYGRGIQ